MAANALLLKLLMLLLIMLLSAYSLPTTTSDDDTQGASHKEQPLKIQRRSWSTSWSSPGAEWSNPGTSWSNSGRSWLHPAVSGSMWNGRLFHLLDKRHHIARKNFSLGLEEGGGAKPSQDGKKDEEGRKSSKVDAVGKRNNIPREGGPQKRKYRFEDADVNKFMSYICGKGC